MIEDGYTRYDNVIATPEAISGGLGLCQHQILGLARPDDASHARCGGLEIDGLIWCR